MLQISKKWQSDIFENVFEKCLDVTLNQHKELERPEAELMTELAAICF